MSGQLLVEHCSPTLAGIKTGNLFKVSISEGEDLTGEIREFNRAFAKKGLRIVPVKKTGDYYLIYVYRPQYLVRDLNNPDARSILSRKGYELKGSKYILAQLVKHLSKDADFPHEIGLFLGYPPADVLGFMNDPRKGVMCTGSWKAYSNPEEARKTFSRYSKCRDVYKRLYKNGRTLDQLTVNTER